MFGFVVLPCFDLCRSNCFHAYYNFNLPTFFQLYYHHSTVQQLKAMYKQILRPEALETLSSRTSQQSSASIRATPVVTEKERGRVGGKKDKEKGGAGAKEKRGKGGKDSRRQSVSEVVQPLGEKNSGIV